MSGSTYSAKGLLRTIAAPVVVCGQAIEAVLARLFVHAIQFSDPVKSPGSGPQFRGPITTA